MWEIELLRFGIRINGEPLWMQHWPSGFNKPWNYLINYECDICYSNLLNLVPFPQVKFCSHLACYWCRPEMNICQLHGEIFRISVKREFSVFSSDFRRGEIQICEEISPRKECCEMFDRAFAERTHWHVWCCASLAMLSPTRGLLFLCNASLFRLCLALA